MLPNNKNRSHYVHNPVLGALTTSGSRTLNRERYRGVRNILVVPQESAQKTCRREEGWMLRVLLITTRSIHKIQEHPHFLRRCTLSWPASISEVDVLVLHSVQDATPHIAEVGIVTTSVMVSLSRSGKCSEEGYSWRTLREYTASPLVSDRDGSTFHGEASSCMDNRPIMVDDLRTPSYLRESFWFAAPEGDITRINRTMGDRTGVI